MNHWAGSIPLCPNYSTISQKSHDRLGCLFVVLIPQKKKKSNKQIKQPGLSVIRSTVELAFLVFIAASKPQRAAWWGGMLTHEHQSCIVWWRSNLRLSLKHSKALAALLQLAPWHSLLNRDPNGLRLAECFQPQQLVLSFSRSLLAFEVLFSVHGGHVGTRA